MFYEVTHILGTQLRTYHDPVETVAPPWVLSARGRLRRENGLAPLSYPPGSLAERGRANPLAAV